MILYFGSGYLTHRTRKIGLLWSGQTAEHLLEENMADPKSHPIRHMKVQQLAKSVLVWEKKGDNRYLGIVIDQKTGVRYKILTDIYPKFALLVTGYKY